MLGRLYNSSSLRNERSGTRVCQYIWLGRLRDNLERSALVQPNCESTNGGQIINTSATILVTGLPLYPTPHEHVYFTFKLLVNIRIEGH